MKRGQGSHSGIAPLSLQAPTVYIYRRRETDYGDKRYTE